MHHFGQCEIGIDVGGTKSLGILRHEGDEVARCLRPTPQGAEDLIDVVVEIVDELARSSSDGDRPSETPPTVGVGLPGLVTRAGVLRAAPNLIDVSELDARGRLSDRLDRDVRVENDASCAAIAEWLDGAARGCENVLVVTIGTGIGAGLVVDGALVRGANGFAGELGHMFVDPSGPPCPCGRSGCWERYASGSGLAHIARQFCERAGGGDLVRRSGSLDAIRGEHITELASAGSTQALEVLDEFAHWIAVGLANMTNVLDPERIVLGGGAASMGDLLIAPVRRWLPSLLYASEHRPIPTVVGAQFGDSAGAVGASMLHRIR